MKMLRNFMWMAAAAITLASCSNEEEVVNAGNKGGMKQLILIAENPDLENDSRTAIGEENGKIVPMWEAGDYISIITEPGSYIDCPMKEVSAQGTLSKTAEFVLQYDDPDFPTDGGLRFMYDGINEYRANEPMNTGAVYDIDQDLYYTTASRKSIGDDDILVSDIINIKPEELDKPVKLKLKRLTAVVRMKINDITDGNILKNEEIDHVNIRGLSGSLKYRYADKTLETSYGNSTYDVDVEELNYKPGDDYFVFSCLPRTFKAGEKLTIGVKTRNKATFTKTLTAGEEGILFESGKITTLTLNLRDSDMTSRGAIDPKPDETLDPTIEGNVITMQPGHPGRLTSDMIIKAIGTGKSFKVVGDINAFEINSIRKLVDGRTITNLKGITADLSEANIKASDNVVFIAISQGGKTTSFIDQDNIIVRECILVNSIISEIILPNSLTMIHPEAISCERGTSVTIGKNIESIGYSGIILNTKSGTGNATLKILAEPSETLSLPNDFYRNNESCDLILNNKWNGHKMDHYIIDGNKWVIYNSPWASISFCDVNGNPIP